jgi:hypothetical protein
MERNKRLCAIFVQMVGMRWGARMCLDVKYCNDSGTANVHGGWGDTCYGLSAPMAIMQSSSTVGHGVLIVHIQRGIQMECMSVTTEQRDRE